jgi:hypothetical protein
VAVTRFVNIYGGGDLNFSRIIPDSVRAVLRGHNPVIRSWTSILRSPGAYQARRWRGRCSTGGTTSR